MEDFQKQKDILHKLVKARESIKQKYKLIKYNKANTEQALKETFQPIVEPLQKIANDVNKKPAIESSDEHNIFEHSEYNTPKIKLQQSKFPKSFLNQSPIQPNTSKFNLPAFNQSTPKKNSFKFGENESMNFSKSNFDDTIVKQLSESKEISYDDEYIRLLKRRDATIDKTYGPQEDNRGGFMLGKSPISFTSDYITVNGNQYPRTVGLTELILLKRPSNPSKTDTENYKKILLETGVHLNKNGELKVPKSNGKFTDIIGPLLNYKGRGVLPLLKNVQKNKLPIFKTAHQNTFTDYRYWDDANELVDRLRLLVAERDAGNNNHDNEILAIIEELREANYIY